MKMNSPQEQAEQASRERRKTGLDDPRALDILTTEHWSLLSTRNLGYQEMFGRTTIFIAVLSAIVIAIALLAQASHFGREILSVTLLLIAVSLFIGLTTFVRSVSINAEDARWVMGLNLLRKAYLKIVPELEPYFVTGHDAGDDRQLLAHGSPQRLANLGTSLTTTSSVVATLNSVLAGSFASDVCALFSATLVTDALVGTVVSLVSGALHVVYAARFRENHASIEKTERDNVATR